jgi:hypothetical protein
MGNLSPQPEDSNTTGCLKILLIVICVGLVLLVATCTAIFVAFNRSEASDQTVRQQAAERLLKPCTQVRIWNDGGAHTATISDAEARLFGSVTQKTIAREADTGSSLSTHRRALDVEVTSSDGSVVLLAFDTEFPAAYCIESIDTWFFATPPLAVFATLVWVTLALEAGVDQHTLSPSVSSVQRMFDRATGPDWPKWEGLSADERAFVSDWFKRFNAVSGEAPLDASKLFPAK